MQKLPEASERKRGNDCARKRDRPDKRTLTLSAATSGVPTPRSFLLTGGGRLPFH